MSTRAKGLILYLALSLLGTTVLVFSKIKFEHTKTGERFEMFAYDLLLWPLPSFEPEPLPIVVVDISRKSIADQQPTPRDFLKSLITSIADKGPRGIAVDIDFSPTENDWVVPDEDPDFFDFCLGINRNKAPLFLGVGRAKADPPDTWLGLPEYQELAAAIAIDKEDQRRVPLWIQSGRGTEKLKAMSVLLAEAYGEPLPTPPPSLSRFIKPHSDVHKVQDRDASYSYVERVVNYSKFHQIYHERLSTISPISVDEFGDRFTGKLVIIGDPKNTSDAASIPGTQQVVGGVFVHANAVYTFVKEPLYELKESWRIAIDFIISLFIVLVVGFIRWLNPEQPELWRKAQSRLVKSIVFLIIPAGIVFVYFTHILWLDFLLVLFALLLHPSVEEALSRAVKRVIPKKAKPLTPQPGESS